MFSTLIGRHPPDLIKFFAQRPDCPRAGTGPTDPQSRPQLDYRREMCDDKPSTGGDGVTMKTRDRIIEAAIALFNDKGTAAVSTNHIATAVGISPGNLYYHFRNKEDILGAIYDQMDAVGFGDYQAIIAESPAGSLEAMERTFLMIQRFNWRYRFFKRELTALILQHPQLRERHIRTHRALLKLVRHSIDSSIDLGLIRPMDETERQLFTDEIWLLTLFWLNYLEVGGEEVTDETLRRGNEVVRQTVRCRLTDRALHLLATMEGTS